MQSLYIITNQHYAANNTYKLATTTTPIHELLQKYKVIIQDPVILYYTTHPNITKIETDLKNRLTQYKTYNKSGILSEWLTIDYNKLITFVNSYIATYLIDVIPMDIN